MKYMFLFLLHRAYRRFKDKAILTKKEPFIVLTNEVIKLCTEIFVLLITRSRWLDIIKNY